MDTLREITMKTIALLILLLLSCSVYAEQKSLPKKGLSEVVINITTVNMQQKKIPLDEAFIKNAVFNFPVISGGIFGMPDSKSHMELLFLNEKNQINFDLKSMKKSYSKQASKLLDSFKLMGLETSSKKAKIARLGSFAYNTKEPNYVKGAWFSRADSDKMLMIVYFDRKTTLVGTVSMGGEVYKHQVSVPKKGFYWLESDEVEKGVFNITRVDNFKEVDLVVKVNIEELTAMYLPVN